MKTLITYVYYDNEINLNFFIKNGLYDNKDVTYNFIIKSDNLPSFIPKYKNVNIIKMENIGYDFAGYARSINYFKDLSLFDKFVFINDTVRGPFVPRYNSKSKWYINFNSLLSDKIKLIGPTINMKSYGNVEKHVQSMCFGTDNIGIGILKDSVFNEKKIIEFFNKNSKWQYIMNFEVKMSGIILNSGYEISSFIQFENIYEFSSDVDTIKKDIHFENMYFDLTINPIEVMFIKTNRINDPYLKLYSKFNGLNDELK